VADGDVDNDSVPDYADGYNLDPGSEQGDGGGPQLTPIKLKLSGGLDPHSATLIIAAPRDLKPAGGAR
jgi:hypothetical protein